MPVCIRLVIKTYKGNQMIARLRSDFIARKNSRSVL